MNRKLASILTVTSTAAAMFAVAAIASGNAYAETPTIDDTPFVSSRTRAEVRAEVLGQSEALRNASSEWAMQQNDSPRPNSAYTREAAKAEYIAARDEVNALNSEDSGSSYIASQQRTMGGGVIMAGETGR